MLSFLNTYLFAWFCPLLLLGAGAFLIVKLRFFSLLRPSCIKAALQGNDSHNGQSPFRAMTMALAGTLGVGNIVGVSSAIAIGGAGAVFWMVLSAVFAMSVKYGETVLAVHYRVQKDDGVHGGPMYYIQNGLNRPIVAKVFCMLCVGASFLIGNLVQTDAVVDSLAQEFHFPPFVTAMTFAVLVFLVCVGGAKRIGAVTARLIPLLSVLYLAISFAILFQNANRLPLVTKEIFSQAFSLKPLFGAGVGVGLQSAIRYGVARGLMSNEAGCGTAPIAHAASSADSAAKQGIFGIFEVGIDTILLCTVTAYVLLLAPKGDAQSAMGLALCAYGSFFGGWLSKGLALAIVCFAFATVVGWSYYALESIAFLSKKRKVKRIYLCVYAFVCLLTPLFSQESLLDVTDFFVYALTILNTICVLCLVSKIKKETDFFQEKVKRSQHRDRREKKRCRL